MAMRFAVLMLALLPCLAASTAGAALVKCAGDRGGVVYQDVPCPAGRELRDLEADPATLSVVPWTPVPAAQEAKPSRPRSVKQSTTRTSTRRAKSGNAAERRFIRNGMSEAEVIMRIGRPDVTTKGGRKAQQRWSHLPTAGDADTVTTLTLTGGKVVEVERRVAR